MKKPNINIYDVMQLIFLIATVIYLCLFHVEFAVVTTGLFIVIGIFN